MECIQQLTQTVLILNKQNMGANGYFSPATGRNVQRREGLMDDLAMNHLMPQMPPTSTFKR